MDFELRRSLADIHDFPWWACRLPRPLECRFVKETGAERNRQIRFWVVAGLVFSWLNCAADIIVVPDTWRLAILLRLCVVTPVAAIAICLLVRPRRRLWEALATIVPPAACLLSVLVVFSASAEIDTFRAAIVLSIGILWMNVLIPMRVTDSLIFTVVTLVVGDAINLAAASTHHVSVDHPDVVITTHILVALSVLARVMAEQSSRRSFLLGLRQYLRAEDLARSNAKLLEMSNTDPLTGLANRRYFDQGFAQAWQTAAAARTSIALLMIDIDYFKAFNDAAGHLEGDRCLVVIARTISEQVRAEPGHTEQAPASGDLAARFGGEEFVVLLPGASQASARAIAERVHTAVAALQVFHPGRAGRAFVSVSVGVAAVCPGEAAVAPAALLAAADQALYAAKAAGRDRVTTTTNFPQVRVGTS